MASARCGGACGCDPMQSMGMMDQANTGMMLDQLNRLTQMNEMMMLMMMTMFLRQMTGAGGGTAGGGGIPGMDGMSAPGTDASSGGGSSAAGSSSPGGSSSAVNNNDSGAGSSGSDAVELGRRFLGRNAIDIRGQLSHFTAAGGQTNNCADFVSSCLESTGRLQGHHVGVRDLEQSLQRQGYHQVPASQAKPGDVWISNSRSHTELVASAGATRTLGSNNDRPGHQVISERAKAPGTGVIYSRG